MKKIINPWIGTPGYDCIGCAPNNPLGLHMEFYEDGELIVSHWTPNAHHQSWPGTLHGGVQALIIDEISAWAMSRKLQVSGVTTKMELRYRHHIPTNEGPVTATARIREQRRNLVTIEAKLQDPSGRVCTEATCLYFTFPPEKAQKDIPFKPFYTEDEVEPQQSESEKSI